MLTLDLTFFLVGATAVVFAGVSKGGFGSTASFASATLLALVVDPGIALAVMLPLLMLIDVSSLRPYWGKWNWHAAFLMIVGAVPGVALGAALFSISEPDHFRVLIGSISVGFVAWHIASEHGWTKKAQIPLSRAFGMFMGLVAGFTSFVSHAGGPPAAVYLLSQKFSKTEFQATTVLVFWVVNIAKFVPYWTFGMFTQDTAIANLILAPFAIFGTWLGVRAHYIMPERVFFNLTYVLLFCTGSKLIWDGMT